MSPKYGFMVLVLSLLFIVPASIFANTATAVITANCEGFEIHVTGSSWLDAMATYEMTLKELDGTIVETATGSFSVLWTSVVINGVEFKRLDTTFPGAWSSELCGVYKVSGSVRVVIPGYFDQTFYLGETETEDCPCDREEPGTGTPGFWKNHLCAWPIDTILIGGRLYSKETAVSLMDMPVNKDKTYSMFQQLVSAKLNVAVGNEYGCVSDAIDTADAWMTAHEVGSGVKASSDVWQVISEIHDMLDDYNNGLLCVPHRDDVDNPITCNDNQIETVQGKAKHSKAKATLSADESVAAFPIVQNFPNPFNPTTTIEFSIPSEGMVTVEIYNSVGERIEVLTQDFYGAGVHAIEWNATAYSSGTYFYRLTLGSYSIAKKLLYVK